MNEKEYLTRIGYTGKIEPTLEALQQLQKSHLLSVPFENLDIHYGIPIQLDIERIFNKIVRNKRGGFCYELNGLFFELLTVIGFETKRVSARVYDGKKGYGQEYDHLALVVNLNGKEYLTDVGFGEFTFRPLQLQLNKTQNDERGHFIIAEFGQEYLSVSKVDNGETRPEYTFKNLHRDFHEFNRMCHYHQTNQASHFTRNKLITIPTEHGRITLTSDKLKKSAHNSIEETVLEDEAEFRENLRTYFKIELETDGTRGISKR
jgi:N-hydroxyarylamine O-acetyltransferase